MVLAISILSIIGLMLTVLLKVKLPIIKNGVSVYSFIPLIGGIIILLFGGLTFDNLLTSFTDNSPSNPIKILILFLSMSTLSVFLDECGFFEYVATISAKKAGGNQKTIFLVFYITVSILTIFTSNDVVILTFTPFICFFCKKSNIDAIPYVVAEFVGANTWSLLFLIGNPTNVYLTQSYNIKFLEYFSVMWLPTIFAGVTSFLVLFLVFNKRLNKKIECDIQMPTLKNKTLSIISGVILLCTTICIALASQIGLEMWLLSFTFLMLLIIIVTIYYILKRKKPTELFNSLKRAPWQMIPLIIGMFIIVLALNNAGVTQSISELLGGDMPIIKYGVLSTLSANLLNNIPMSVFFASVIKYIPESAIMSGVYATVIGSNIGAFLTPIGALAGLMFTTLLKDYSVKFTFLDFIKYGVIVTIPTLFMSLLGLYITIG